MKTDSVRSDGGENRLHSLHGAHPEKCNSGAKGRILRVKQGYNPNSSSMGSVVFALPAALLGITAGFGVVSGIIMSAFIKGTDKRDLKKEQVSADAQGSEESAGPQENNQ